MINIFLILLSLLTYTVRSDGYCGTLNCYELLGV
jgi:hypothetical protein